MTIESMIPTFEVGERVICHCQDVEWNCPGCGLSVFTNKKELGTAIIVTVTGECGGDLYCNECGYEHEMQKGSGWWEVECDNGDSGMVPYTLLETIPPP